MAYLLVVDDDEDFTLAVSEGLRLAGHEVHVEPHIGRALKTIEDRRPDLVVLDVMFPQGSSAGFELARTLRHEREELKSIPILMLTALGQRFPFGFGPGDIDGSSVPVDGYLEKPVDPDFLREEVSRLLARAGASGSPDGPGAERRETWRRRS
ncbi:MAG TPA: response regulator [Planctomycetota bacterium]|nr:response regulator [Planctomycetota bacterium]